MQPNEEVVPLCKVGDRTGAKLSDAKVTMPPVWKELFKYWTEGSWNSLNGIDGYGGQGLPTMMGVMALEMRNSALMSFGVGPTLSMGMVETLEKHASDDLKASYFVKLVSGEWMGTMNLTESKAGSDLVALRTRAKRAADGTYRIFGQKIFITYGEHDLTDNIVHLVLARLPDSTARTRSISLFLVPKFFLNEANSCSTKMERRAPAITCSASV